MNHSFYEMSVKSKAMSDYYLKIALGMLITFIGLMAIPFVGTIMLFVVVLGLYVINAFIRDKNVEYEYTFTDDNIEIAAILDGSKRKELMAFDMGRVFMVVPKGSLRIDEASIKVKKNYTSKNKDAKVVCFVLGSDQSKQLVMLEPDEKALEHIKTYGKSKVYDL